MTEKNNFSSPILIGFAGKAHGIKGEITAKWLGEFPPQTGMLIRFVKDNQKPVDETISSVRYHNDRFLLFLKNVKDRTKAEELSGSKIYVDRSSLPPPDEGEVFLEDLLGAQIYLSDNTLIGTLDHVEFPAEKEIWVITQPDGKEFLFPATEEFIENIDLEARKVHITPPPGLLDIYRA